MTPILRILPFLVLIMASHTAHAGTTLLGVLEDLPGVYAGEGNSVKVRVLFKHTDEGWSAFRSNCPDHECLGTVTQDYPGETMWSIMRMGQPFGKVLGHTPSRFPFYSHVGLQDIVSDNIPEMGTPSTEFGSFVAGKLRRPLVATSLPTLGHSTVWRSAKVSPRIRHLAYSAFRSRFSKICKIDESDQLTPYSYREQELRIHLYSSEKAESVMSVALDYMYDCQTEGSASPATATFVINKAGELRFLGQRLQFIDAGDFEGDGQTEVLFAYSGDNRGGYVLFSSTWHEQARFVFSYH